MFKKLVNLWNIPSFFMLVNAISNCQSFLPSRTGKRRRKRLLGKFFGFYLLAVPLFVYLIATRVAESCNDSIFGNRKPNLQLDIFSQRVMVSEKRRKKLVGLIGKVSVYGKLFSGKRFLWKIIKEGRLERRLEARIPRKRENWEWWVTRIDDGNICSSSFSLVIPRVNQFIRMMIHGWVKRKEK